MTAPPLSSADDDLMATLRRVLGGNRMTPAPRTPPVEKPQDSTPWYERAKGDAEKLMASPFADTLRAIAGTPSVMRYRDSKVTDGTEGEYGGKPGQDTVSLDPMAFVPWGDGVRPSYVDPTHGAEWVLSHELGHRYDAQTGDLEAASTPQRFQQAIRSGRTDPETWRVREVPNKYANTNRQEYSAQAFANGIDFLRKTAQLSPDESGQRRAAVLRAQYETEVPGTTGVVDDLLSKPVFGSHPLNLAKMAIRPDALRTLVVRRKAQP